MNQLDKEYQMLLEYILGNGVEKKDRTGTGTLSVFGWQIRHKMSDGFPLLTTKKMAWKTMVTELLWFLRGDTNIKFLVDNGCHIWDGDAYKAYQNRDGKCYCGHTNTCDCGDILKEEFINKIKTDDEFAKKWGELGPIYGKQWRGWGRKNVTNYDLKDVKGSDQHKVIKAIENGEDVTKYGVKIEYQNNSIDQIQNLINDLKTNPDSRRLMVSAWNVGELDQMVLPPCHYGFQVYTRELSLEERLTWMKNNKTNVVLPARDLNVEFSIDEFFRPYGVPTRAISLMWNQRSVDTFLGLPFNIASYGLLLEIIAKAVNMVPDELIGNLGDTHLYSNHIEQAKEQITREPFELPKLNINTEFWPYEGGECGEGPLDAIAVFNSFKDDNFCKCLLEEDIQLGNYQSHPAIKAPLSN
jgi:thymidylate synthase